MDDFNTIRLKKKVIEKFKEYSKKTSPSYSETLDYMIAFFEDTGLSPYDTMHNPFLSYTRALSKRTKAVMTILRTIEKTQLIPTREMLESLFVEKEEEPLQVEKKSLEELTQIRENKELKYYREAYHKKEAELNQLKQHINKTVKNFKFVNSTFGTNHYLLKLTKDEYNELKDNLRR